MNQNVENKFNPRWLKSDSLKITVYSISTVITLGTLALYCYYYPLVGIKLRSVECDPEFSDCVIVEVNGVLFGNQIQHFQNESSMEHLIVLELDCVRYIASSQNKFAFSRLPDVPRNFKRFMNDQYFRINDRSLLQEEFRIMTAQYGPNVMSIPDSHFLEIALKHMLSPFFLFQYFSAIVWLCEDYQAYACLILVITFVTVYITSNEELFNLQRLKTLAGAESTVRIVENNRSIMNPGNDLQMEVGLSSIVPDSILIPGDRFFLVEGMTLPCDAVLVRGRVVVDESMLTGEAVPVSKVSIDTSTLGSDVDVVMTSGNVYQSSPRSSLMSLVSMATEDPGEVDIMLHRTGSVLFGGTKISAVYGEECLAVVCRTGFRSAKGQLVASLLKPREGLMHFISDALWIIVFVLIMTTTVYAFIAYELYRKGIPVGEIFLRYLDSVTSAVPPLLTASLTVATAVAIDRLKLKDIYVSDTSRVNYAGMVNAVSFDKTGTLTETSLHFVGASLVETLSDQTLGFKEYLTKTATLPKVVVELMATCHSLSLAGYNGDEPTGDPLEMELLAVTGWSLRQTGDGTGRMTAFAHVPSHISEHTQQAMSRPIDNSNKYDLCKHFEFTPDRLRAATILRRPDGSVTYLLKGSPEVIVRLCEASGTVPAHIEQTLVDIARRGLRVIAVAARECLPAVAKGDNSNAMRYSELMRMSQDDIERLPDMKFIGLLFLSNSLKTETVSTISQLDAARIHTNMITGDHVFTAIAVASQCGIINRNQLEGGTRTEEAADNVFIVDEAPDGSTIIVDAVSNERITHMTLAQLLMRTATSYHSHCLKGMSASLASEEEESFHTDGQGYSNIDDQQSAPLISSLKVPEKTHVQIAVTGKGLASVHRNYSIAVLKYLVRYARIFARTKPHDKKFIVEQLMATSEFVALDLLHDRLVHTPAPATLLSGSNKAQVAANTAANSTSHMHGEIASHESEADHKEVEDVSENFEVLFCGDGANDMTALRAASVGVSLCDAETSVAAPVTSRKETPGSVIDVLKEGRCSLITAYVLILFNVLYGAAQLFLYCVLYFYGLKTANYTSLEEDVVFALVLSLVVILTPPADILSVILPPRRFLTTYFVGKLCLMLVSFVLFHGLAQYILSLQSFYVMYTTATPLVSSYAYEATVAQDLAIVQIMMASVVATIGAPFRQPWYTNGWHVATLIVQLAILWFQIFAQNNSFLQKEMQIKPLPTYFGFVLLSIMALHVVVCVVVAYLLDVYFFRHLKTVRYENMRNITLYTDKELEIGGKHNHHDDKSIGTPSAPTSIITPKNSARKTHHKQVSFTMDDSRQTGHEMKDIL